MEEIWKSIPEFEDYTVSNLGRVMNKHGRIMKPSNHKQGYKLIGLKKDKKLYCRYVHRLVALAFIPNPDNLPQVNHKDECRNNNCVDNLEWCTSGYNINYGTRNLKVSIVLKGRPLSEEKKKKISAATKGCKNPFYGKHHSEESKNKMRSYTAGKHWKVVDGKRVWY